MHQYVISQLLKHLLGYVTRYPVAQVLTSPADISWGTTDVLVQPDIFVVPHREMQAFDWTQMKTLLLAIEVLSPSTRRYDRFTKRRAYQEFRVPLYWVVDSKTRAVEVWTPDATLPTVERERVIWHPEGATEPLIIPVADILPPVDGRGL